MIPQRRDSDGCAILLRKQWWPAQDTLPLPGGPETLSPEEPADTKPKNNQTEKLKTHEPEIE